ncbi:MAG: DegV family protein [Syntrophomonadaceae bacterium]|nr:DegV family protein [Syntrophomonadaceae bacterium]
MNIKIITDTSCDLPDSIVKENDIDIVPLRVIFEDGEDFLDRYELTPAIFASKLRASQSLPKTASPDPAVIIKAFAKGLADAEEVLFISLSSPLSSTCQNAHLARDIIGLDRINIFDSLSASLGTGLMVIKAARMARQGLTMEALLERLTGIRNKHAMLFTLDTLENLVKGGRIHKYEGITGDLLSIKPIMTINPEGLPVVTEKVRGRKRSLKRLLELADAYGEEYFSGRLIGISHLNCLDDAEFLAGEIKDRHPQLGDIIISDIGATIGTYVGEGGVLITF